jgi:Mrp family chromosome partitioning ATPase
MSRNFDLLAEIEREHELGSENGRVRVAAIRPVATENSATSEGTLEWQELFRLVRGIFLSGQEDAPRQVVFVGVEDESSSSSVCANAGRILADSTSKPVCVVDANVHSARLSQILGIEKTVSISGKSVREQCVQVGGNLWLAGTDLMTNTHGALLPVEELKPRLTQLGAVFEYLLIDAPGVRVSRDAEFLALRADAAVLVIEANKTRRTSAAKAKESLEAAGVRLLGTLLNDRSFPIPEKLYKLL